MSEIPRRLSVHDKGYDHNVGVALVITLDGVEQRSVVAYDIDASTVTRHVLDGKGNAQVEPGTDDVWVETVTGTVEVTITQTPTPGSKV